MNKNKKSMLKCASSVLASAMIISAASANAAAAANDKQEVKAVIASEHTDVYTEYLNGNVTVDENSGVKLAPYAVSGTYLKSSSALPSSYKSENTPVRDQGNYNTCWAFSSICVLENFLLKDGKGAHDLSEQHLSWWSTKEYNSNDVGWLMSDLDSGGYSMIGAGYLMSWQGAKEESEIPYSTSGNTMPDNMDSLTNPYNTTGIIYVENDIETVKTAVYNYGAVATSYNSGSGYGSGMKNYYQGGIVTNFSGHAITIVGWDDSYSASNFKTTPPGDGAWLVKNSWGDGVCEDGYIWISYYDRYILDSDTWGANIAVTQARTNSGYDRLYQNEEYGATYTMAVTDKDGNYCQNVTFVNQFDFDSEHNILQKVIFETENPGASYTVYYIPVDGNEPVADSSLWTELASGTVNQTGYLTVDTNGFSVPSGKGAIGVTIDTTGLDDYSIFGVDEWLTDRTGAFVFKPAQSKNQSYIILGGKSYDLVDVYAANNDSIGGTFVIKALATSQYIGDVNLDNTVTTKDAFLTLRIMSQASETSEYVMTNADADFNGVVTSKDAFLILKYASGKITSF